MHNYCMKNNGAPAHFRLTAKSRSLSLKAIWGGTEDAAYETFKQLRWENGEPVCPKCGVNVVYEIKTRRRFQCKACFHHFSVTSGTIFASRKLSYRDLLAAICILVNAAKGLSAVQLSQDLSVQYKTAWVLAHKLREAMASEVADLQLTGTVEMDGVHFKGKERKANQAIHRKKRPDGRTIHTDRDRVVIAIRERNGRTRTFVRKTEKEGVQIAKEVVSHDAIIFTDEARHWNPLYLTFDHRMVNHEKMYVDHGKHTRSC